MEDNGPEKNVKEDCKSVKENDAKANENKPEKSWLALEDKQNLISLLVLVIAVIILATIALNDSRTCHTNEENETAFKDSPRIYWAYGRRIESGYLHNVFTVLDRLGYKNDPNATDWDLLWAHDYPFRTLYSKVNSLQPHQKVNKFPGSGYITNKVDLATSNLKYIPPAFRLPTDKDKLLDYAKNNPVKFVQKNNEHRHIHIKVLKEIDLDAQGSFVQEFVDKPLLIDGFKFDIGIYTIITSVDPLRIYIYNGDALLRFCPKKYYPFDPNDVDKYVVGDDYLPTWDVPSLRHYYKVLGFGMKQSLNEYLRTKGKDASVIWEQIEDSIRIVVLAKEQQIVNVVNRFPSKSNFFEMMRFDFVVNEDLKVYLMEANMSPNLSSAHFPPNKLLFEQVIYNLLGLVGVGERTRKDTANSMVRYEEQMQVADKNIAVFPEECSSPMCRGSCVSPICLLCRPCLSEETRATLTQAFVEHMNKGDCKRIFPLPLTRNSIDLSSDLDEYSVENQLIYRWFQGKCLLDASWCT